MTHDELLALLNAKSDSDEIHALRAVVKLHNPDDENDCNACIVNVYYRAYPCPTIQAIEKCLQAEQSTPVVPAAE